MDATAYTVDNLYVCNIGATAPVSHTLLHGVTEGTVDVGTKTESAILAVTNTLEADIAKHMSAGRDIHTLKVIGFQRAFADGDKRIRLVFGVDAELKALHRYGFDMTLSYSNAAGDTVVRYANVESYTVFASINGKDSQGNDKNYVAGVDYDCGYFATLVVNPTIGGEPISGGATVTITAYTVDSDGYRHAYGAETVTLVFDGNGNLILPSANIK